MPGCGERDPLEVADGRSPVSAPVVTLLRPPVVVMPGALATHGPTPPLGAAYVAAAVRNAGYEVQLIDGAGEAIDRCVEIDSPVGTLHQIGLPLDEIVERIDPRAVVVGVSTMFLHEWPTVRELARRVKAARPDVVLVIGGENATAFHPWILDECEAVDACVLGEGESTMVAVVDRVAHGMSLAGLGGTATRGTDGASSDGGLPVRLGRAELSTRVPRPAWDLVPLDAYWQAQPFFGVDRGRSINVLGTRGCPFRCSFCSSPQMWTTRFVMREPEDVADEIAGYVERYGIRNVNFVDLTAATNRRWTLGLCDAIEARGLDLEWQLPVGTRIEGIDAEVLRRLWETGCRNVTFAPESGSPRLLAEMDKRVRLDHMLDAVRDAHRAGLHITINILLGHPKESRADRWASARFLAHAAWLGCSDVAVMMFCPYPGSADFDDLVARGEHVVDEAGLYVGLSRGSASHRSWNRGISARSLRRLQLAFISLFYATSWLRRPQRAWRFLVAVVTGREDTYLEQMVRTRRRRIRPTGSGASPPDVSAPTPVAGRTPAPARPPETATRPGASSAA